jgi:hypothetical protein
VPSVAEHVADIVEQPRIAQVALGDELGPERVAGQQHGLGNVANLGFDVGTGHFLSG